MKKFFLIVPICLLSIIFVCYIGLRYSTYNKNKHEREYELIKMDSINRYKKELDSLKVLEKELKAINEEYNYLNLRPEEIESMYGGRIKISSESHIHKAHKQVLIIVGDDIDYNVCNFMCNRFADGAKEVGGKVEILYLCDYGIPHYDFGTMYNINKPELEESIDADSILKKMIKADIIVFEQTFSYLDILNTTRRLGYLHHRYENSELKIQDKEFFYITTPQDIERVTYFLSVCRNFVMDTINAIERGYTYNNPQQAYELGKSI